MRRELRESKMPHAKGAEAAKAIVRGAIAWVANIQRSTIGAQSRSGGTGRPAAERIGYPSKSDLIRQKT